MYLDTCIEPWPGGYTDPTVPAARRTNYALREEALALRPGNARAPTAVLTHGANPGLVSHLVKQALLNIAADTRWRPAIRPRAPTGAIWRTVSASRSSTSPSATPRCPASQGSRRVRQHLVGRRLRQRGLAAGRARLGIARAQFSPRRQAPRFRLHGRDLPDAARGGHARAHLDAAGGPFPRLLHHARRGDLDRRLLDRARRGAGGVPADRALRLSPLRCGGRLGARVRGTQFLAAGARSGS